MQAVDDSGFAFLEWASFRILIGSTVSPDSMTAARAFIISSSDSVLARIDAFFSVAAHPVRHTDRGGGGALRDVEDEVAVLNPAMVVLRQLKRTCDRT
ncbi:unnamed protein product [Linum trigynum]|uniref:Uncharacterized protein n=1 Tax=Linum trigynum TaxID=586398 RepID=A0AAV2DQR0_9ROSI